MVAERTYKIRILAFSDLISSLVVEMKNLSYLFLSVLYAGHRENQSAGLSQDICDMSKVCSLDQS